MFLSSKDPFVVVFLSVSWEEEEEVGSAWLETTPSSDRLARMRLLRGIDCYFMKYYCLALGFSGWTLFQSMYIIIAFCGTNNNGFIFKIKRTVCTKKLFLWGRRVQIFWTCFTCLDFFFICLFRAYDIGYIVWTHCHMSPWYGIIYEIFCRSLLIDLSKPTLIFCL